MLADTYQELNYTLEFNFFGHSKEFYICSDISSLRTDIAISCKHSLTVWGQLRTSLGLPFKDASIELFSIFVKDKGFHCAKIMETQSDANGFYLFVLKDKTACCYQLIIKPYKHLKKLVVFPQINPCTLTNLQLNLCQQVLLDYLNINFPSPLGYKHELHRPSPPVNMPVIYALPHYT